MIELAVRDWLHGRPTLMGLLQNDPKRLDTEYKGNIRATHITLYRSGGGQGDYVPLETALVTFHCYGSTQNAAGGLVVQLTAELRSMIMEPLNASTHGHGASVESISWLPAGDSTPRYVVVASITASLVAPAA